MQLQVKHHNNNAKTRGIISTTVQSGHQEGEEEEQEKWNFVQGYKKN